VYASQNEPADQRAIGRANKIAKRVHDMWGGVTEHEYEFPPKPPRMRWTTYQGLEAEHDRLQNRWSGSASGPDRHRFVDRPVHS
jgi:hypothetical protein